MAPSTRTQRRGRSVNERPYRDLYTLRLLRLLTAGCGTKRTYRVWARISALTGKSDLI